MKKLLLVGLFAVSLYAMQQDPDQEVIKQPQGTLIQYLPKELREELSSFIKRAIPEVQVKLSSIKNDYEYPVAIQIWKRGQIVWEQEIDAGAGYTINGVLNRDDLIANGVVITVKSGSNQVSAELQLKALLKDMKPQLFATSLNLYRENNVHDEDERYFPISVNDSYDLSLIVKSHYMNESRYGKQHPGPRITYDLKKLGSE